MDKKVSNGVKIAVIETGAKQYRVSPGDKIKVEKLNVKEGDKIDFDKVLLISNDGKTVIGAPIIEGAKVTGDVLKQGRHPKVTLTKYKAKERQRVHKGHKQPFTEIKIVDIVEK
ncbi:50S ribosomal protein L21 [Patescibacteria group bacterium]|nr:50S ribosomal protein L21 [Patescibacteria group bacterium]